MYIQVCSYDVDIWFLIAYVFFAYWQFMAFLILLVHNLTTKWLLVFLPAVLGVQKAQQTSQECMRLSELLACSTF